jgi:hypothetical protein
METLAANAKRATRGKGFPYVTTADCLSGRNIIELRVHADEPCSCGLRRFRLEQKLGNSIGATKTLLHFGTSDIRDLAVRPPRDRFRVLRSGDVWRQATCPLEESLPSY